MNTIQNPYNRPLPQQRRMKSGMAPMKFDYPSWLPQYAIVTYILALMVVNFMYSSYSLPWYYVLSGIVALVVFFFYGSTVAKQTSVDKMRKANRFEKRMFLIAFIPRIAWMLLIYYINMQTYGDAFGFENADATFYNDLATDFSNAISRGEFLEAWKSLQNFVDVSDMGYAAYMGLLYSLTGISIIVARIMKCVWASLTVVLVYRLAKRNFGEKTGRLAAIFVALWPNFWYYCGTHLKETEMVFLTVLFVEQADQMLRSRQFTAWKVVPVLLIAFFISTFRTPLAIVAMMSLVFTVVMSSQRVVSWGKRILVGLLAVVLIALTMGNRIQEESKQLLETARSSQQEEIMKFRTERENGNAFAKYAGSSVFAPMIFTIPFPSMVRPFEGQEIQQLLNGGNFVKNILSCFTIFAMVMLLMSGKWREHLLPLSFMLGYLVVLTFSSFAHSERFHQPSMPLEFMFAAYGLSIALTKKKYKRWFTYWCALMFVAVIAWNWFKVVGRGLA